MPSVPLGDVFIWKTLSNDDGDGNKPKKGNRLNDQNNNSARVLHFLLHFFAITARLGRESS